MQKIKTVLTQSAKEASEFIRNGGIAAFPTETVYGLGAGIFDEAAIRKIFAAKMRPPDNPLIAHIGKIEEINLLAKDLSGIPLKLIEAFFPGPLTIVLDAREKVPLVARAGLPSIGIRMPRNPLAIELIGYCGFPLVAPSANLSGRPSPTDWKAVYEDLNGRIDCILQGEPTEIGIESTVLDCTGSKPLILRRGGIPIEEIRKVCPEIEYYLPKAGEAAKSPGLLHRHYSPKARILLIDSASNIDGPSSSAYIGISGREEGFAIVKLCRDTPEYARELFAYFRECDALGIAAIYCEKVSDEGIGAALMERLMRAAEPQE